MFSKWSLKSRSRAIVTPSVVTSGAPYFLSRTTERPRGPRVTATASATASTPWRSSCLASVSNRSCLAGMLSQLL